MLEEASIVVALRKLLYRWSSRNILFWINTFVWALDTRETTDGTVTPFVTYDYQDEDILKVLKAIKPPKGSKQHDIVIEKSRDMGATWIFALVLLWFTLYSEDVVQFFVMSYKEDVVDGSYDSVMGKMKFALEHLPSYLFPGGKKENIKTSFLKITNTLTGSTIGGCSSTENSGVSGRYTAMLLDEFSLVKEARAVRTRTTACSNCRLYNGTHRGPHLVFAELVRESIEIPLEEPILTRGVIEKIQMHWSRHPLKRKGIYLDASGKQRSPWYDEECARMGNNKIDIARELDMNADASGAQVFDGEEISRHITLFARDPVVIGRMDEDSFIPDSKGNLRLWFEPARTLIGRFGLGCDISAGTGATPSTISGVQLETGEKVLEFLDGNVRPDRFAKVVWSVARWLNDALVCYENAGSVGGSFRRALIEDLGYSNVYLRRRAENSFSPEVTNQPGWYPSNEAKTELIMYYREALTKGLFTNRSERALREALSFVYTKEGYVKHALENSEDDASGAKGLHGDLVIADMQASMLVRDAGIVKERAKVGGGESYQGPPPYGSIAWQLGMMQEKEDKWDGW